ncbi:MAG TPA: adenylate/guanylate cyclase domain-containing protein [Candidatus Ozemobacteraceae bacterium]|nr:adenylate/guanylate cyclase domain-containing protein [Candidatus Ozemobacteraceae bacterium]
MAHSTDTASVSPMTPDTSESGSLLVRLFLFVTIVVLPLSIAAFAFHTMYREELAAGKVLLRQKLAVQSGIVARVSQPEYQIRRLTERLVDKGLVHAPASRIEKFVNGLERRFPGAFKWVVWDENGTVRAINSPAMLSGQKTWEAVIRLFLDHMRIVSARETDKTKTNQSAAIATNPATWRLQRALGPSLKIEQLLAGYKRVLPASWLGKNCRITWSVEATEYTVDGNPCKIKGGFLLMVFPELLPPNFWLKSFISSRPNQRRQTPYPVMMMNLRDRSEFFLDPALKHLPAFAGNTLAAYLDREEEVFERDSWLLHAVAPETESPLRVVSCANFTPLSEAYRTRLARLYLILAFLLLLAAGAAASGAFRVQLPLRGRITGFFVIAIIFPVAGIITIGRSFVAHEEARLRDEARKDMRGTIEAVNMRYHDIALSMEQTIFKRLTDLIGTAPLTLSRLEAAIRTAEDEELIANYFLSDEKGAIARHDRATENIGLMTALPIAMKQIIRLERTALENNVFMDAVQDELSQSQIIGTIVQTLCRPSHLNYYCFGDLHLYLMSMRVFIDGKVRAMIVNTPAQFLERFFATREFTSARHARELAPSRYASNELFFYARVKRFAHLPEQIPLWKMLEKHFQRAGALNVSEEGEVTIDGESFLYLISPLQAMITRSYIPCVLTSLKPIQNRILQLRHFLVILVFLALVTAVALGGALAGSLLAPIRRMDRAVQRVGTGNLDVQLPVTSQDEFGRLSGTFNTMVRGLRERERMRAYVSETVLEAVRDDAGSRTAEGEFLEASILFSDIRGFTSLSERYPPKDIFAMLNAFMSEVEPIIRCNEGRVDKFIGDAVMAVFHAGAQHHAIRAVLTAVSMMRFLEDFNASRAERGLFTIRIGIGVNTGRVMLGDVGSAARKDLTVIGDEVNLASRLETASKKGRHTRIVLSESTFNAVSALVEAEEMPFTEVTGKQQPVRMFELIRLRPVSETRPA